MQNMAMEIKGSREILCQAKLLNPKNYPTTPDRWFLCGRPTLVLIGISQASNNKSYTYSYAKQLSRFPRY